MTAGDNSSSPVPPFKGVAVRVEPVSASVVGCDNVWEVSLANARTANALGGDGFRELRTAFEYLGALDSDRQDVDCRCILLMSEGKTFCSGINLNSFAEILQLEGDPARRALRIQSYITSMQDAISACEKCSVPVIALVDGPCVGAGVDLVAACDIRLVSSRSWFSVAEIDLGLAADLGTLQRLPRIVGNTSWVREVCLTGRRFYAEEANRVGLVNNVYTTRDELIESGYQLGATLASKSPVAMRGAKTALASSTERTIQEGLLMQAIWNGSMLQTEDVEKIILSKQRGADATNVMKFAKL